jgi:putative ubiquitin-RnfH superfamily antitoxin RatB of RatAB toxin-antitoxin module
MYFEDIYVLLVSIDTNHRVVGIDVKQRKTSDDIRCTDRVEE